ncbi:hypothetical protein [Pelomonas cellulosilytica]|uniref:GP-PDE domain-containing protein n=1 Tax=Pelomonas cellulosilytica TaxID=2906762 RepID=A0ABS8XZM6_9BURK|nr:hypothetical protein [Pelomonas sp. P8]MCE4558054.1 hypothetical protein [Pelomonas sp. P8]
MTGLRVRRTPRYRLMALVVLVVAAIAGVAAAEAGRAYLHLIDSEWLGERVMDTLARVRSVEDWSSVLPLRPDQDYAWIEGSGAPVRIAHALGESGSPTANTLAAMRRSYEAGLRLFEVDLILDRGELRCQHDPGPPSGKAQTGCTFDALLAALPADAWLVLDIKTDFASTGQRIVDRLKSPADARRVVFQLYRPEDFARFDAWQQQAALPGPIVTAYLAHRRLDHVALHAARAGVRVLTVPIHRLPALSTRPVGLEVMVHPVHDCVSWDVATRAKVNGVYALASLRCVIPVGVGTS